MYSFILLRDQSLPSTLTFLRSLSAGAGNFNKWQWKRMHEKKAREKHQNLLHQENHVHQSRIRTEKYDPTTESDRFTKPGGEDLWNEADGPVSSSPPTPKNPEIKPPIDLRKLISRGDVTLNTQKLNFSRNYSSGVYNRVGASSRGDITLSTQKLNFSMRHYSSSSGVYSTRGGVSAKFKYRRNESSDSEDSDYGFVSDGGDCGGGRAMRVRSGVEEKRVWKDSMSKIMGEENSSSKKKIMRSRGALGEFDTAKPRRVLFEDLREELMKKDSVIDDEERSRVGSEDQGSVLSEKRFDEYDVSPLTIKALNEAGYVQMTRVQEATFSVCLDGGDALVKAKTGTAKSVAFLLPAIETVLKASNEKTRQRTRQRIPPIFVLILCPTRELASQVAAEANVLLRYHDGIGVQTLIGSTRFKDDQKRLESEPCQIIVATPGRLLDHIENKSGVTTRLMGLKLLVLDEADHMVDLGFRKDIEKIFDCLPRKKQSIMFSAAVPKQVRRLSQLVLKREHKYIDSMGMGCVETPDKIKQFSLVAPHEQHFQMVYHLLNEHASKTHDYKVIVFCSTEMVTSLLFLLLREMKLNVREIHSRKPQLHRTRVADEFRESNRMILITSDVPSHEMNYPDVTLVIQVGVPSDREQYIHRLGSTGQEGKEGDGILLLAPWEAYFLEELKDLPIEKVPSPQLDPGLKMKMKDSMMKVDGSIKEGAYHAWLSHYNSITEIGRDKTTLAELANQFSQSLGFEKPPQLFKKTALKMELYGIPGIRIRK